MARRKQWALILSVALVGTKDANLVVYVHVESATEMMLVATERRAPFSSLHGCGPLLLQDRWGRALAARRAAGLTEGTTAPLAATPARPVAHVVCAPFVS